MKTFLELWYADLLTKLQRAGDSEPTDETLALIAAMEMEQDRIEDEYEAQYGQRPPPAPPPPPPWWY